MQSSTSSHTAVIPESSITYRTVTAVQPLSDPENRWKFYLTDIPAHVTSRLTSFGALYILIGLLSIGLEVGLWVNDLFVYGVGVLNGGALLYVGLMCMILGRQQNYALSTLFAVVFAQMFCSIGALAAYALVFFYSDYRPFNCEASEYHLYQCKFGTVQTILLADLIHVFTTFCIVVSNLSTIVNARRPMAPLVASPYIVYNPQSPTMPVSFQNPAVVTVNHA